MRASVLLAPAVALGVMFSGPAHANTKPSTGATWVASPNGVVGVQQLATLRAPRLKGSAATFTLTTPSGATNAGQAIVNGAGFAYLPWTPNVPGTWTLTATSGGASLDTASLTVVAMPTSTELLVQGEVQPNVTVTIIANVAVLGGSITPSGTVTVRDSSTAVVATGTLTPTGVTGRATASMNWTPGPSSTTLQATYNPGSTAFSSSVSPVSAPWTTAAQAVSLRLPQVMFVGVPATLSSVVNPNYFNAQVGGSQAFNLTIQNATTFPMGGSQPINTQLVSTVTWAPTQPGAQTIGVEYGTPNFQFGGRDSQIVNVQPAPTPDTPRVIPSGATAWTPGSVGSLQAGNTVQLSPSSTSGNPVTLSSNGPCVLEGATVTALGAGTCVITASSLGNSGTLSAATAQYSITVTTPPKKTKGR